MSEKKKFWRFSLTISEKNHVELNWSYLSSRKPNKRKEIPEELLQEFQIELINEEGILVKERIPKLLSEYEYCDDVRLNSAVPFNDRTKQIILFRHGKEVFRLPVPQKRPSINLLQKEYNIEKEFDLDWDFDTSTPENTWFRVFIELDNGKRYPLSDIIRENKVNVDFSELPGCERGKVIVMVSDGVWTAEDISKEFKLPFKKPSVRIVAPKNGQKVQSYDLLELRGKAWDQQNLIPIDSENLVWKLDGKFVGKGRIFVIDTIIALGKHIISLDAVDNNGISNSDEIEIEIYQAKRPKIIRKDK